MAAVNIKRIIKSVVNEGFPGGEIESIRVRDDTDYEGDPILVIDLIVRENEGVLDPTRAVSLIGELRSRLVRNGIISFPVLSFISKAEAEEFTGEAA